MSSKRRLIDAKKLHSDGYEIYESAIKNAPTSQARDYATEVLGQIEKAIKEAPTVDAVPVVRCKDCEYWENGKDYEPYCNYWEGMLTDAQADDFCSRGERRTDGSES